jgi:hypothetical protein
MIEPESHKTQEVDMSSEAIDRRLRNVSQLHELGMAIRKARTKDLGRVEDFKSTSDDGRQK